jgi:squalene-associated FAD-dependent desaturase
MTLHIVGAGMAGLAAAVAATQRGTKVVIHESAKHAGGRCRSFYDSERLGCVIDNGNHLLLSGNATVTGYLHTVGASGGLYMADHAAFPFVDLADGSRWTLTPGAGRLPLWLLDAKRRVPGTSLGDYLAAFRLAFAGGKTLDRYVDPASVAWRRFWEPLAVAVLNTAAEEADIGLMWPVLLETFFKGEAACRPLIARQGLSDALVDPALTWLRSQGAELRLGRRLRGLERRDGRAAALVFDDGAEALGADDRVILALPAPITGGLLPELVVPDDFRAIVNGHFRTGTAMAGSTLDAPPRLVGVIGGVAQWLFLRGDMVSVTVSAADTLAEQPPEQIAARLWGDIRQVLGLTAEMPSAWRIVKEKRATFAQTPAQVRKRPGTVSPLANVFLAGDWTDTGLPATIEGAMRSGEAAARRAA